MLIVALGDLALDVVIHPAAPIHPGSDTPGLVQAHPGGSAANVAVWVARQGAESAFVGAIGDDHASAWLAEDLRREGVVAHLTPMHGSSAAIAVLVDATGERAMIADRGVAALLTAEALRPEWFPARCWLHVPAYSFLEGPCAAAALRAVDLCRAGGGSVGIDASSVGPLHAYGRDRFLALLDRLHPDLLFVNAAEGAYLAGDADPAAGLGALRRYAGTVVWKLGPEGAAASGDGYARVPGLSATPRDTTGAGDAFAAAFTIAHARGQALESALGAANRLAARVVQGVGARPRLTMQGEENAVG